MNLRDSWKSANILKFENIWGQILFWLIAIPSCHQTIWIAYLLVLPAMGNVCKILDFIIWTDKPCEFSARYGRVSYLMKASAWESASHLCVHHWFATLNPGALCLECRENYTPGATWRGSSWWQGVRSRVSLCSFDSSAIHVCPPLLAWLQAMEFWDLYMFMSALNRCRCHWIDITW